MKVESYSMRSIIRVLLAAQNLNRQNAIQPALQPSLLAQRTFLLPAQQPTLVSPKEGSSRVSSREKIEAVDLTAEGFPGRRAVDLFNALRNVLSSQFCSQPGAIRSKE